MIAGQLEVQLLADMARLRSDMDKGVGIVTSGAKAMERAADGVKSALGGIAGGLSVAAFAMWVRSAVDAADALGDLKKSTSLAVTDLAGLGMAAQMSGGDLNSAAKGVNKLAQEIGQNRAKFASIGITARDNLGALVQLADLYVSIEDPQLRNAVAAEALGTSWAGAAPMLAEGGDRLRELIERGGQLSGVNDQMVDSSDRFNDKIVEMQTFLGGVASRVAGDLLPVLEAMSVDLHSTAAGADRAAGAFSPLTEALRALIVLGGNVMYVLRGVGTEIGGMSAQAAAFLSGDFAGAAAIGREMKADAQQARAAFDAWEQRMMSAGTAAQETAIKAGEASRQLSASQMAALKLFADPQGAGAGKKAADEAIKAAKERAKFILKADQEAYNQMEAMRQERAMAEVEESKQREQGRASVDAYVRSMAQSNEQLALERSLMGASAKDRAIALEQYRIELEMKEQLAAIGRNLAFEEAQREEERAKVTKAAAQARRDAVERIEMDENRQRSERLAESIEDGILNGFRDGRSLADVFLNELKAQFARTVLRPMIQPMADAGNQALSGALGGLFKGIGSAFGFPSPGGFMNEAGGMEVAGSLGFSGGGYTGNAPRSGGLDGQGGFMAMLHPQETVVDHAKGQTMGGTTYAPTFNIKVDARADQGAVFSGVQRALRENNKAVFEEIGQRES